jgi:hypothetical protein
LWKIQKTIEKQNQKQGKNHKAPNLSQLKLPSDTLPLCFFAIFVTEVSLYHEDNFV